MKTAADVMNKLKEKKMKKDRLEVSESKQNKKGGHSNDQNDN